MRHDSDVRRESWAWERYPYNSFSSGHSWENLAPSMGPSCRWCPALVCGTRFLNCSEPHGLVWTGWWSREHHIHIYRAALGLIVVAIHCSACWLPLLFLFAGTAESKQTIRTSQFLVVNSWLWKQSFKTVCLVLSLASAPVCRPRAGLNCCIFIFVVHFCQMDLHSFVFFSMYYNIVELTNKGIFLSAYQTDVMRNINVLQNKTKPNTSQRFFILAEIMFSFLYLVI
jgi:hypothetical protein